MTLRGSPTQVCITVDTEFSIGSAFGFPLARRPIGEEFVTCPVNGREHGLGFLLESLAAEQIQATFFVEALNVAYFGDAAMGRIVERILGAGQDVQLHLHPCWLYFRNPEWQSRLAVERPNDRCDGRELGEMTEMIELGLDTLRRWGARPIALRTGGFHTDRVVYDAMKAKGLALASNISVSQFPPAEPLLRVYGGRRLIGDVLEIPALTFHQPVPGRRHIAKMLSITGASSVEIENLLWQARTHGISPVVVVTHPFEFVKSAWNGNRRIVPNRITQARLRRLCRFIAEHPDEFTSASFGKSGPAWLDEGEQDCPELSVPPLAALGRMIVNKINDALALV